MARGTWPTIRVSTPVSTTATAYGSWILPGKVAVDRGQLPKRPCRLASYPGSFPLTGVGTRLLVDVVASTVWLYPSAIFVIRSNIKWLHVTTCRPRPIRESFLREIGNWPETRKFCLTKVSRYTVFKPQPAETGGARKRTCMTFGLATVNWCWRLCPNTTLERFSYVQVTPFRGWNVTFELAR